MPFGTGHRNLAAEGVADQRRTFLADGMQIGRVEVGKSLEPERASRLAAVAESRLVRRMHGCGACKPVAQVLHITARHPLAVHQNDNG